MVFWGFNHYPAQIEETVQKSAPSFKINRGAAFSGEIEGENRLIIAQEIERSYCQTLDVEVAIESLRWEVFNEHFVDVYAIVLLKPGKIQRSRCRELFFNGNWAIIHQWQRSPKSTIDMISLLERYLNPITHLRRYLMITRAKLRRFFLTKK